MYNLLFTIVGKNNEIIVSTKCYPLWFTQVEYIYRNVSLNTAVFLICIVDTV